MSIAGRTDVKPFKAAFEAVGGFKGTRKVIFVKCPEVIESQTNTPVTIPILEPSVEQVRANSRAISALQQRAAELQRSGVIVGNGENLQVDPDLSADERSEVHVEAQTILDSILRERAKFVQSIVIWEQDEKGEYLFTMPIEHAEQVLMAEAWEPLYRTIERLSAKAAGLRIGDDEGRANFPARTRAK